MVLARNRRTEFDLITICMPPNILYHIELNQKRLLWQLDIEHLGMHTEQCNDLREWPPNNRFPMPKAFFIEWAICYTLNFRLLALSYYIQQVVWPITGVGAFKWGAYAEIPTSGDLKSGDSPFCTTPPNVNAPLDPRCRQIMNGLLWKWLRRLYTCSLTLGIYCQNSLSSL